MKIELQVKQRESQHLDSEVIALRDKRANAVHEIGVMTDLLTRAQSENMSMRDEVERLKRECQEARIDIEERARIERDVDREIDDTQIEYGTVRSKVQTSNIRCTELQAQYNREREYGEEIKMRIRN